MILLSAEILQRRLERERLARAQAEALLEQKSRELFEANERLRWSNDELESRVAERTEELVRTNDRLEQQAAALEEMRAASEASNVAKSSFLANMSHEIRTPMTAILGFVDLLADSGLSEAERAEWISTIRRNGSHLLSVINDILDLSKIEAGQMSVERVACDPAGLLEEAIALLRVRAQEKRVGLALECAPEVRAAIYSDPMRLRQIVLNIVGNAIKFTDRGSVTVRARLEGQGPQEAMLVIGVTDTGVGLTDGQISTLFRAFQQADESNSRRFGGTGLGLAISRDLARRLGGDITVTSRAGEGSCFTIRVRAVRVLSGGDGASDSLEGALTSVSLEGVRVLMADDGGDNRRLIAWLLRKAGAEVDLAEQGQEAVDRTMVAVGAGRGYDVILMDMQMPVLDGYGATAALRARGVTTPIVALTARAMAEDRQRCLDAGCDDYDSKPIDRVRLLELCRRWADAGREGITRLSA